MSNRSNIPEGAGKFLQKEEYPEKIAEWKKVVQNREQKGFSYNASRVEENTPNVFTTGTIEATHGRSFIKDAIPSRIEKNKPNKTKILILGMGVGSHAEQIRRSFPSQVDVVTTGLKTKSVLEIRKYAHKLAARRKILGRPEIEKTNLPLNLDKNDLKVRSILEMHDFPEFDLIIDSQSEQFYSTNNVSFDKNPFSDFPNLARDVKLDEAKKYWIAIISKLKPDGLASVAPIIFPKVATEILEELKQAGYHFEYKFVNNGNCLEITKIL